MELYNNQISGTRTESLYLSRSPAVQPLGPTGLKIDSASVTSPPPALSLPASDVSTGVTSPSREVKHLLWLSQCATSRWVARDSQSQTLRWRPKENTLRDAAEPEAWGHESTRSASLIPAGDILYPGALGHLEKRWLSKLFYSRWYNLFLWVS